MSVSASNHVTDGSPRRPQTGVAFAFSAGLLVTAAVVSLAGGAAPVWTVGLAVLALAELGIAYAWYTNAREDATGPVVSSDSDDVAPGTAPGQDAHDEPH